MYIKNIDECLSDQKNATRTLLKLGQVQCTTLSAWIPPLDGVQTLPSLPGPVSRRVKRNAFVAGSRFQTG